MTINAKTFRVRRRDPLNLILERHVIRNKGTEKEHEDWENVGYYGKLEDLVKYLVNSKINTPRDSNLLEQLPELLKEIKRVELSILEEIRTFNGENNDTNPMA